MNTTRLVVAFTVAASLLAARVEARWPAPVAPVVPTADGYVVIPNVAKAPDKKRVYRAIFDATQAADSPAALVPALNMAGSELNALAAAGVPPRNVKFAVVFHGAALDGILDEAHYKAKFGTSNPNLEVLGQMRRAGVELFVCGQNLAFAKVDPATISPEVTVASDALLVSMQYQNDGYALMSF